MSQPILLDVQDGVALITINRPERHNAFSREAGDLFEQTMADVGGDPAVKAIVVTGTGDRSFCPGADVESLDTMAHEDDPTTRIRKFGERSPLDALPETPVLTRTRYSAPLAVSKPVIAAVNGACAGVGLSLATHCDIRFASRTAIFAAGFPRRGLTAEAAVAWTLQRLVGHGAASDILLSGRKITAQEAFEMGLVNKVLEPQELMPHAMAYAHDVALNASPRSTAVIKRQLRLAPEQTYDEAMMLSFYEVLASLTSEDFKEGVASFREHRTPNFIGR